MGRFLSRDPIGFAGGDANLYRYANRNPTTLVDPSGLRTPFPTLLGDFGKGFLVGAGTTLIAAGLLTFGGPIGAGIAITGAIAGGGIFLGDLGRRLFTGQGYTDREIAEILGAGAGGTFVGRSLSAFPNRINETLPEQTLTKPCPTKQGPIGKSFWGDPMEPFTDPYVLEALDPADVAAYYSEIPGWDVGGLRRGRSKGLGLIVRQLNPQGTEPTGLMLEFHPGTRRHFNGQPYWKVSQGNKKTVRFTSTRMWRKP